MSTKDEKDYMTEDREDLVARLMGAQRMARFLLRAYAMHRAYGVDFQTLPEWKDQSELDRARRLKAHAADWAIGAYFERLENALSAAVKRKQMTLVIGGKSARDDETTT